MIFQYLLDRLNPQKKHEGRSTRYLLISVAFDLLIIAMFILLIYVL